MKIDGENNVIPPIRRNTDGPKPERTKAHGDKRPDDAVEISDRGKLANGRSGRPGVSDADGRMRLTIDQVRTRLQERIRSGFYDNDDILQSVAGDLLDLFGL